MRLEFRDVWGKLALCFSMGCSVGSNEGRTCTDVDCQGEFVVALVDTRVFLSLLRVRSAAVAEASLSVA
jgi:hypothetical protein